MKLVEHIKRIVEDCFKKNNSHLRKTAEELDINPKTVRKWLDFKPENPSDQTQAR